MTTETGAEELAQLAAVLRDLLGTTDPDAPPAPDVEWRTSWPALAEVGLTGFCVPESLGGLGWQVEAAVVAARELGGALHGSPFAGLTASISLLGDASPPADDLVGAVLDGRAVSVFGLLAGDDGQVGLVDGIAAAEVLVALDPVGGEAVAVETPAWEVAGDVHGFDVTRTSGSAHISTDGLGRFPADPDALLLYRLLLAADALGGLDRMLARTVTYARNRIAFGRPIGGFQAVQHRLVDHSVQVRGMELLVSDAARALAVRAPDTARRVALSEAAVSAGSVAALHDLLQLTGAIGFTWEHGLHLYERRAHQDARLAANPRSARRTLAELEGWTA